MRSISVQIRLCSAKRGDDDALGEEMPGVEPAKQRNGETRIRRLDAFRHRSGRYVRGPANKPRYAMGLGTPPQLLELIARGVDMFDCVLPTRLARNGTAFTATGTVNLKNAEFILDKNPIEENCACEACREYSRGYIRHLIKAEEILGLRLITLHNLHFYLNLM